MSDFSHDERRRVRRASAESIGPLRVSLNTSAPPESAKAVDVSVLGIGLETTWYVDPGTTLTLRARYSSKVSPVAILAQVLHAKTLPEGMWFLGCGFLSPLTSEEILELGATNY